MLRGFANRLTLSRIVVIPLILLLLLLPSAAAAWLAMVLYVAAAITDWLDGFFARRYGEVSKFGQFLDPVADKLLVSGVILILVYTRRISGPQIFPALVILLREVAVSGLREFLAGLQVRLPVSQMAKWKTAAQMVALPFLIVAAHTPYEVMVSLVGALTLWVAGILTIITGWDYWQASLKHFKEEP